MMGINPHQRQPANPSRSVKGRKRGRGRKNSMYVMNDNDSRSQRRVWLKGVGFVRGVSKKFVFFRVFALVATRWRASV